MFIAGIKQAIISADQSFNQSNLDKMIKDKDYKITQATKITKMRLWNHQKVSCYKLKILAWQINQNKIQNIGMRKCI